MAFCFWNTLEFFRLLRAHTPPRSSLLNKHNFSPSLNLSLTSALSTENTLKLHSCCVFWRDGNSSSLGWDSVNIHVCPKIDLLRLKGLNLINPSLTPDFGA